MSNASFVAYIDESGDEGFKFGPFGHGSSLWFVLGAAIIRKADDLEQVKLIDEVRARCNERRSDRTQIPPKKPLHFRDLSHEEKRHYARAIGASKFTLTSVLIDKSRLTNAEDFAEKNRLYFYATRLLVERISWFCRDLNRVADEGDGSVDLVFSNRASMNYEELGEYFEHLENNRVALDYRAAPSLIKPGQILTFSAGRRMGLQIADATANCSFAAVEPSFFGLPDDNYWRLLQGRHYRRNGILWGYGMKLFPGEAEEARRRGEVFGK